MLRATTVPGSDYINASFVDVRLHYIVLYVSLMYLSLALYTGLQAAWSIHSLSNSIGEYDK